MIDVTKEGLVVREIFSDVGFDELVKLTGVPMTDGTQAARAA
jgi:3-oxoadipate CoA-transferase beta subunit